MNRMIHPHTYIHPNARVATNVKIDPFSVIHQDVEVGEGTWIGSNVTIMEGARIGKTAGFPEEQLGSRVRLVVHASPQQRLALVLEHVERHVHERAAARPRAARGAAAVLVERADDPVEHALAGAQRARHLREQRPAAPVQRLAPSARTGLRALEGASARTPCHAISNAQSLAARACASPARGRIGPYARARPERARLRRRARSASSSPCRRGARARAPTRPRAARRAGSPSACRPAARAPARRCRDPRCRPCRRRTRPPGSRPRSRRTRAGDPRRARRARARLRAAARRAAAPSSAARRPARAGSRSAAAAPSDAARRRSAPFPIGVRPFSNGSGVLSACRLAR